jgi:transcriptional regulator with XRE-family HTH domain
MLHMYEKPTSTFAERLREAIDTRDVSMAEVARKTNISTAAISRYLRGDYEPKQDKMYALAKYLMVNPAWLMGYAVAKTVAKEFFPINNITLEEKSNTTNNVSYETLYKEIKKVANSLLSPEDMKLISRIQSLSIENRAVLKAMIETMLQAQKNTAQTGGEGTQKGTPSLQQVPSREKETNKPCE